MAHAGQSPKLNRQRKQAPARGDWKQLEALLRPLIPDLDEIPVPDICGEAGWPYTSKMYWSSWRKSPVTALWTEDDVALAIDTITAHAEAASGGRGAPPSEIRLRMESLGLTPKGRTDRRLLLPEEKPLGEVVPLQAAPEPASSRSLPEPI